MTEPIKQEIIGAIYENGEQLITGPVLQEVLLDMVDDYNSKVDSGSLPEDLLEKTGSWDSSSEWVEENKDNLVHQEDLEDLATKTWVQEQGYLTEHQDISGLATTESVNNLSSSIAETIDSLPQVDLSGYATTQSVNEATESVKSWVEAKHYLTTASLSGSVTEETVGFMIGDATSSVKEWVENKNYLDSSSLEGYATEQWVESQGYLTEHQDLSGYLLTSSYLQDSASFNQRINDISGSDVDLSGYATTASLESLSSSVDARIDDIQTNTIEPIQNDVDTLYGILEEANVISFNPGEEQYEGNRPVFPEDLDSYATTSSLNSVSQSLSASIAAITGSSVDLSGYLTTASYIQDSASFDQRINDIVVPDLSEYATTESVSEAVNSLEGMIQDIYGDLDIKANVSDIGDAFINVGLAEWDEQNEEFIYYPAATSESLYSVSESISSSIAAITGSGSPVDLSGYATTESVNQLSESLENYLPISGGNITGDLRVVGRLRVGSTAINTTNSLALGTNTIATNPGEIVGGINNRTGSNQLFAIGVGESTSSRRNALLVKRDSSSSGSGSVYVQGVGSYDGTNPQLGVNDLATVINSITGSGSPSEAIWQRGSGAGSAVLITNTTASANSAAGTRAVAHGHAVSAIGSSSHAEGSYTSASGHYSHAEGSYTTATGNYSHTEGFSTKAQGSDSHAEGRYTSASGQMSHAEGFRTTAEGRTSHAEGSYTTASGYSSHAEGIYTTTVGSGSHAEGIQTVASGISSHAEGSGSTASGDYSHAQGIGTITSQPGEFAAGKFNRSTHYRQIFSIGIGPDEENRKNLLLGTHNTEGVIGPASGSLYVYGIGGYEGGDTAGTKDLATVIASMSRAQDLSGYATTESLNSVSTSIDTRVTTLSASFDRRITNIDVAGSSDLWTTGSGKYSIIRKSGAGVAGERALSLGSGRVIEPNYYRCEYEVWAPQPSDSNPRYYLSHEVNHSMWERVQIGDYVSSNMPSEAARVVSKGTSPGTGSYIALSRYIHTPVWLQLVEPTVAEGTGSVVEGRGTLAVNNYEHAEGQFNATASGQIFSIGVGTDTGSRKNAISIITSSSPASVYILGVGGYDGTNPQPGVNDVASVIAEGEDLSGYATTESVNQLSASIAADIAGIPGADISGYLTTASFNSYSESLYTYLNEDYNVPGIWDEITVIQEDLGSKATFNDIGDQIVNTGLAEWDDQNEEFVYTLAATSESLYNVSESLSASIASSGGSGGGGDYLPLTGGTVTGATRIYSLGIGQNADSEEGTLKISKNLRVGPTGNDSGDRCLAVGNNATNTNGAHYSVAVGENCRTSIYGGFVAGRENVVESDGAFGMATGFRCRTIAMAGYAGGCRSTASANFASAIGFGAEARSLGQVVLGSYNEYDPAGGRNSTGSYAVILGNGKSSTWNQDNPGTITRSNGLAIRWDGGIDISYSGSVVTLQNKIAELEARIADLESRLSS